MPKGIPLTKEEQNRRRHEIFDAAVALFLEKGFEEISMQQIARTLGIGKSTLYDYFPSKDEILISFVEDAVYDLTELARQICAQDLPAAEKLRQVLRQLKEEDLGISITVSGIVDEVFGLANELGLQPHTVNLSLGIHGKTELLPPEETLELTTMCGHALMAKELVK